jgi:hypothetical protein
MSEVFRPGLLIDEPADVVYAPRLRSFLRFLVFPFRIVTCNATATRAPGR